MEAPRRPNGPRAGGISGRSRIIENYIAPYKANVRSAKEAFELMRSLHEAVYGLH